MAQSLFSNRLGGNMIFSRHSLAILGGVCVLHMLVLGGLLLQPTKTPVPITPPSVIGVILAAPVEAAPQPVTPQTHSQPKTAPAPRPDTPPPLPAAPPSERAPVNLPAEPVAQTAAPANAEPVAAPVAAAAPSQPAPAGNPGPVTPPRTDAAHLSNPAPVYPAISRRLGEQGRVLFDVYILPDGTVGEIRLKHSSGYSRLDDAALDAVRRWRYVPARRGNEPIPYWYVQPIVYSLNT